MRQQPVVSPAEISGNGCVLAVERAGKSWQIAFASEPRTGPQPLWFHVEASGLHGAPVEFVWEHADICLGSVSELDRLRPVLRADRGEWTRADAVTVEQLPDGRKLVRFNHPGGASSIAAAFCYPYSLPDLDATLAELGPAWERGTIGVTHEGRPIPRLRLSNAKTEPRPGLYLMARQHSGETPGSWALDGILRHLASDTEEARSLREDLDVWVCPMVDLDGVVNGDYGKDALPWDYNRAWERLPMRASVHAIQRDLARFQERTQPRLVVDLHGPGHSTPGIYVQLPRAERPEQQRLGGLEFAGDLATLTPELPAPSLARGTAYASRWNMLSTLGSWVWDFMEGTQCVTVEISYQRLDDEPLTPDGYRDIGRRVIHAAHAWLMRRA